MMRWYEVWTIGAFAILVAGVLALLVILYVL
jgi:hypothetical protein